MRLRRWILLCALMVTLTGCAGLSQGDDALNLGAFDGRAGTFLRRMNEAGMPVCRLVDVADVRVPELEDGVAAKAALEQVAEHSGLQLDWIGGRPLLWKRDARVLADIPSTWEMGWTKDKAMVAEVLARFGRTDKLRPQDRAGRRRACMEAALRFGRASGCALLDRDATVKLVRLALKEEDWLLRRQAVLAAVDLPLPDAAEIVEKAAADKDEEVVRSAALAAGRLGGDRGAAVLETLADPPHVDKRFRNAVRFAVTYGSAEHGGPRALKVLETFIDGEHAYLAVWACRAAGIIGGPEGLALLKKAAEHKDPRRKRGAAIGLGLCRAEGAVEALEPLVMWTTDRDGVWVQPQQMAAISLGRQGGPEAVDLLLEAWEKPEHAPKVEILYALGQIGSPKARAFLKKQLENDDGRLARAAAWVLGKPQKIDTSPMKVEDLRIGVRLARPRVFISTETEGTAPTLRELRRNFRRPDYQRRVRKDKLPKTHIGQTLLWLLTGDEFASLDAAAWACEAVDAGVNRARGNTPSYAGISVERTAAVYDWMHRHGGIGPVTRRLMMHHLEDWAQGLGRWVKRKKSTVFYSRRWGALAGSGVAGLAIFGDSPVGREHFRRACWHYASEGGLCTIRQAQDGGTAGSCYGLHHMFTDCANLGAAIQYGTDWDVATFTKEERGDWLQKQLYFQIHCTYPDGNFLKDGDRWGSAKEHSQYRMQVDVVTRLYRNGIGRAWADRMAKRWPKYYPCDYHTEFVWQFFVFNDPDVEPAPLEKLDRCMLFSPEIDGYALWRAGWEPDDTIVHFHAGDSLDMHGGADQGKFVIFKHKPLADKAGAYHGYGSRLHSYYRSALSANTVVFERPGRRGRGTTTNQITYTNRAGGVNSFEEFQKARPPLGPPVGKIVEHEVTDEYARAVARLDGATPDKGKRHKWTREIVFLGYQYVIVFDRVRIAGKTKARWLLNFDGEPTVRGHMIRFDNPPGRLFCKTLLPEEPVYQKVGGEGAPKVMRDQWRVELTGPDPAAAQQVFLNVLYPADTKTPSMPRCTVEREGGGFEVKVGGLSHVFKAR